ncbi:MAG: hypothetical protein ABI651_07760 [Verrucomicrobiota bacterium]
MRTILICLLTASVVCGCATTSADLNKISLGMPKSDVITKLGKPHSVSAMTNIEFLVYFLDREHIGGKDEYFVKLLNGKVTAFVTRATSIRQFYPKSGWRSLYPSDET